MSFYTDYKIYKISTLRKQIHCKQRYESFNIYCHVRSFIYIMLKRRKKSFLLTQKTILKYLFCEVDL
jgi:hypothetical protein